jgi:magnesium transporter
MLRGNGGHQHRRNHIDAQAADLPHRPGPGHGQAPERPVRPRHGRPAVRDRVPGLRGRGPARGAPLIPTAAPAGGPRARLYDADGQDRELALGEASADRIGERQLLWIDLDGREAADLEAVARAVGLERPLEKRLASAPDRADLTSYPDHIHLVLQSMEPAPADAKDPATPVRHPIDIVAGRNWVVTVHEGPLQALARFDAETEGETRLGALDAGGFLAAIVDEVLADYFELVEGIGREIDRLDEQALRRRTRSDVLASIVALRRRIGLIRRTLAPHRVAFAALARPEMELHDELGKPWPGLTDRLDRAVESVENLRELLLGTFDIHMGRAAQGANDVMKVLTLLSAVFLPAVVLAGVMGMNFPLDFFKDTSHFWFVIGAMIASAATILLTARWRGWL